MLRRYLLLGLIFIFTVNCMLLSLPLALVMTEVVPEPTEVPVARRVPPVGIEVGDRAPDFTLLTLSGDEFTLSEMRGQVIIINFWASWVGPSRLEMPNLQTFFDQYHDDGLNIVGIAFADNPAAATQLAQSLSITYQLVMDDTEVSALYQINAVPETFVLDSEGVILYKHSGMLTRRKLEENVLPLLD